MTVNERLSEELGISGRQVNAAVELLDGGNTVPCDLVPTNDLPVFRIGFYRHIPVAPVFFFILSRDVRLEKRKIGKKACNQTTKCVYLSVLCP